MTFGLALLAAGVAAAFQPSSTAVLEVSLEVDRCLSVSEREVLRLTALELDAKVVSVAEAGPRTTRVRVSCAGTNLRLEVSDPVTGKALTRTLALTTPELDVAGRAVALAVAELVLTSWMELSLPDGPPKTTGFASVRPETRRAAAERVRARTRGAHVAHLLAVAQTSGPFEQLDWGWGGGLRVGWVSAHPWFGADLDLIASRSSAKTALGDVNAVTWSTSLRSSFKLRFDAAWLEAGAGARFGIARLDGVASDSTQARGGVVAGTWLGPIAYAGGGARLGHLAFATGIEAGYALRGVSGNVEGVNPVAIDGLWLAGSLGIGWGS